MPSSATTSVLTDDPEERREEDDERMPLTVPCSFCDALHGGVLWAEVKSRQRYTDGRAGAIYALQTCRSPGRGCAGAARFVLVRKGTEGQYFLDVSYGEGGGQRA